MTIQEPGLGPIAGEAMDAAEAAYWEAAGRFPEHHVGFVAAVVAAVQTQRGIDDAARILRAGS